MPAIKFSCPRCGRSFESSEIGVKFECSCGQRLQTPAPPPSKTVLGILEPEPPPQAIPICTIEPEPVPMCTIVPRQTDETAPQKTSRKPIAKSHWLIFGLLLSSGLLLFLFGLILAARKQNGTGLIALSLIFFAAAGIVISGILTGCPNCHRWWASRFLKETVDERKRCYGLVTRRAWTSFWGSSRISGSSDSVSSSGSGTTTWQERVPVIRTTYWHHYKCNRCGHAWQVLKVREVEDFER